MSSDTIRLYHATASPNSRRVRIFLAEKALNVALVPVDLGQQEQHSEAYRDFDARLTEAPFVADDKFSAADITILVIVDLAARAFEMAIPSTCGALQRRHDKVAARPSLTP